MLHLLCLVQVECIAWLAVREAMFSRFSMIFKLTTIFHDASSILKVQSAVSILHAPVIATTYQKRSPQLG